ncbi:PREDICTED: alpha-tocopherol transfer protein-like, partial [Dinoponera quadriceps]|uniref:Alpha-tocopherol transfer protein-like n=1 Tax=Dinoponera quadriceps TaxID=609295 RepID=A0A6P3Y7C4_DINQU
MSSTKCITLEEELKKNAELKLSDIQILREWCEKQPHLPKIQDMELAIFLHCSYYHIETTKNKIENYYTYRTHMPEIFSNRDVLKVKRLRDAFKVGAQLQLEGKTKEGYNIMLVRLVDPDPSNFFCNEFISAAVMSCDEFSRSHGSPLEYIYIFDATGTTLGHVARLNISIIKKVLDSILDIIIVRMKGIHLIITSSIAEMGYNMIKPFINAELINL